MTEMNDMSKSERKDIRGWVHFGIATGILAITVLGWSWAIAGLKLVTQKEPVAWPAGIEIDQKEQRWTNFPKTVGNRFVIAPDGEIILDNDTKNILGIGTGWDKLRFADRKSNWHISRMYRDDRMSNQHPLQYWRLDICYYTGTPDKVPHVPERCLEAGGCTVAASDKIEFSIPAARSPWNIPLPFRRVDYERTEEDGLTRRYATYYTFSLNGTAQSSWEKVRLTLADPRVRRCYFAKIQFGPNQPVTDMKEADLAAEDFMNYFLPVILQAFPTKEDVDRTESPSGPNE